MSELSSKQFVSTEARPKTSFESSRRERGIVLWMAAVFFIVALPIVGLVVDVGIQYLIQTKLQMAMDSAVTAAARSLSRGNDDTTQQNSAKATAQAYLTANFPQGYLGVSTPTVNTLSVDESVSHVRSITMSASTSVPFMFLNYIAGSATTVGATATASRRDTNVMVVLDRSGSLANSGSCSPAKNAAIGFVTKFADGTDNVGLITFATGSNVDFPLATNFNTASPTISGIIGSITCTGATSSAQGLWTAYQALATLNQPAALNVILFFTDGQPTAVTASLPILSSSSCTAKTNQLGVFTVGFQTTTPFSPVATGGVFSFRAAAQGTGFTDSNNISGTDGNPAGCAYLSNWTNANQDVQGVPTTDYWGNNVSVGGNGSVTYLTVNTSGGLVTIPSNSTGALNMINASTNAADNAAYRIRQGASPGVTGVSGMKGITIFSIGLGNSTYPANEGFLQRVANDAQSTVFDSTAPTGLYVASPTAADLTDAFARVASEILRLAK